MPDEKGLETEEEARERVTQVRATQIFGDTPTDPTIGDVVVPAHDEEAANAAAAAVAVEADENEGGVAADLSPEEAKRQLEPLSAEDVQEGAEAQGNVEDDNADAASDDEELSREEKIEAIKSAETAEQVDELVGDDDRVTVTRAADERKAKLAE